MMAYERTHSNQRIALEGNIMKSRMDSKENDGVFPDKAITRNKEV